MTQSNAETEPQNMSIVVMLAKMSTGESGKYGNVYTLKAENDEENSKTTSFGQTYFV